MTMFDNVKPFVVISSYGGLMNDAIASHDWIVVVQIDYDSVSRKQLDFWNRDEIGEQVIYYLNLIRQLPPGRSRKHLRLSVVEDYRNSWPMGATDEDV